MYEISISKVNGVFVLSSLVVLFVSRCLFSTVSVYLCVRCYHALIHTICEMKWNASFPSDIFCMYLVRVLFRDLLPAVAGEHNASVLGEAHHGCHPLLRLRQAGPQDDREGAHLCRRRGTTNGGHG